MTELLVPPHVPEATPERLEELRRHLVREVAAPTPRRLPWRRAAFGACVACAAGLVAVLAVDPLGGTREGALLVPQRGGVAEASALERTAQRLGGGIVHAVATFTAEDGTSLRTETWEAPDGRLRVRQTFGDGTVLQQRLDEDGLQYVDPAAGTVVDHPWRTGAEARRTRAELDLFPVRAFLDGVRAGTVRDAGPDTYEGRPVVRFEAVDGADTFIWLVDPATSLPVAQRHAVRGVEDASLVRYEVFETLPDDAALLELDVPAGTPEVADPAPAWRPLAEGDPATPFARAAFARTGERDDAPASLPIAERARVALVVDLDPGAQFALVVAPRTRGGPPCYVLLDHDLEGDTGGGQGTCPPRRAPALNAARLGRWWTVGGVLDPDIVAVELHLGGRSVPLEPRGRLLAAAVPAGPPDEEVRLVVRYRDGSTSRRPAVRMHADGGTSPAGG